MWALAARQGHDVLSKVEGKAIKIHRSVAESCCTSATFKRAGYEVFHCSSGDLEFGFDQNEFL